MENNVIKLTLASLYDNLQIGVAAIAPENPKAILQLVHGMCEHKERYFEMMEYLASRGYACVIHDHRGHGESVRTPDDLGYSYAGGYKAAIEDVLLVTKWAKTRFPGLPLYLFGHSMGSLVVRAFTKRYDEQLKGLIVCGSPSRNPAAGAGRLLASICEIVSGEHSRPGIIQKIAFGSFNSAFPEAESPNAWVCSDKDTVKAYDADPLCTFQFTANGFRNLFALMQDAYSLKGWKNSNPRLPVHFIAGEDDPCIISPGKFSEAVDFMRKAGYDNVTSKLYKKMRHEIHNETDKYIVWKDVADTLDNCMK